MRSTLRALSVPENQINGPPGWIGLGSHQIRSKRMCFDVKLAGVMGAWLGWVTIPIAVEIAALSAIAVYFFRHYARGRPLDTALKFPFGLFLAPSIWLCWLFELVVLGVV